MGVLRAKKGVEKLIKVRRALNPKVEMTKREVKKR